MKVKVYVLDLQIAARTRRRALLVGIPLVALLGGAAIVYAAVPNVFQEGQPVSSQQVNQNFRALDTRITALESVAPVPQQYVWTWRHNTSLLGFGMGPNNPVASITFTPPAAGYALVMADYGMRIQNENDVHTGHDCDVATQLSLTSGNMPDPTLPGFQEVFINGNLPTQSQGGTYLSFNHSSSIVVPVSAAPTTVYLNGQMNVGTTGCKAAGVGPITLTAIYFQNNPAATGTPPE